MLSHASVQREGAWKWRAELPQQQQPAHTQALLAALPCQHRALLLAAFLKHPAKMWKA